MKFLKMTGLLMVLSMLAVGCSSDDDDDVKGGEPAELYVYVRDASDNYLLQGAEVEFVQNNRVLCTDETDDNGIALCDNKWDGLVSGSVTININVDGYKPFTQTGNIKPGSNEWEVSLTPSGSDDPTSALVVTSKNVEDLYGTLTILMPKKVGYVRVSGGSSYDSENYEEYTNSNYGQGTTTQNVTFTNLVPKTKYTFTVVAFNGSNKQVDKKTISFTTKDLYNRSDARADVTGSLTIGNGISVTLQSAPEGMYMICYEKGKAPSDDKQIIKDALDAGSKIEKSNIGYVSGLKPGTAYSICIIPVKKQYVPDSPYTDDYMYDAPGKIATVELMTMASNENRGTATVVRSSNTTDTFKYYFKSSNYDNYSNWETICRSFWGVEVEDYDTMENLPDIAWATIIENRLRYTQFSGTTTGIYTWSGLNMSSWYGIVTLGYRNNDGTDNSSIVSRYKFKYGNYDVKTRSVEAVAPVESSGIKYGTVTNEMLSKVKALR